MPMMTAVLVAIMLLAGGSIGAQQRQQDIDLQAAIRTESVDGDLNGAIKQYRAIVERYVQDRALVATALVRMAESYQKLGDAEARKIYERLVREYSDQVEAVAVARARLGSSGSRTTSAIDRAIWTGPEVDMFGNVTADGRFLAYVAWGNGNHVMVRDLTTGTDRALTTGASEGAGYIALSRDGRFVAFERYAEGRVELRLLDLAAGTKPYRVVTAENARSISPHDWSPDRKWVAVEIARADQTQQIAVVSALDGTIRVLKSTDWRSPDKIFFSPDGQFLAYDLATNDTSNRRDLYVMAMDASRETTVLSGLARHSVMGWAPDGNFLLFTSDRSGENALWALPMAHGTPHGAPVLLKTNVGSVWPLGVSTTGALYVYKRGGESELNVAQIDLSSGTLRAPAGFRRFIGSGGLPRWSADGKLLAYRACRPPRPCHLEIAAPDTGEMRSLPTTLRYLAEFGWSSEPDVLNVFGSDVRGRRGTFRVNVRTGETTPVQVPVPGEVTQMTSDGKKFFYRQGGSVFERDISTAESRLLFARRPGTTPWISLSLSPDAHTLAAIEQTDDLRKLLLIPVEGGEPREVAKGTGFDGFRLAWVPDGRAVMLPKFEGKNKELWLIPLVGGAPRKLAIDVSKWQMGGGEFRLDPSGRRIAYVIEAGTAGDGIWAFENFLPSRNETK